MIQIYSPGNTNFNSNGDVVLLPTLCDARSVLGGAWTLELVHPIDDDGRWKYIQENATISVPTNISGAQLYTINKVQKKSRQVIAKAYPVFFDSAKDALLVDVRPTNKSGQQALNIMLENTRYAAISNITKHSTSYYIRKNLMQAINDDENSFVSRWGGEPIYDNYRVIINERAGGDYSVQVLYGKNIKEISEVVDMSDVATRILPVSFNGHTLEGATPWVDSPLIGAYPIVHSKVIHFEDVKMLEDAADGEEGFSTLAELRTELIRKCQDLFENGIDKPKVTLDIKILPLSKTDQYKGYEELETIGLGDTVHCKHAKLGITTEARAIEVLWDCITNTIKEVVIGDYKKSSLSRMFDVESNFNKVFEPKTGTVIAEKVQGILNANAVSLRAQREIAQQQHVRAIVFEDLDPDSPTFGCLAIGTQGWEISNKRTEDGRGWEFTTAATGAGITADVIVSGLLADKTGRNYFNLDSGEANFESYNTRISAVDNKITLSAFDTYAFNSLDFIVNGSFTYTMASWEASDANYVFRTTLDGVPCVKITQGTTHSLLQWIDLRNAVYKLHLKLATDPGFEDTARVRIKFGINTYTTEVGKIGTTFTPFVFDVVTMLSGNQRFYIYNDTSDVPVYITDVKLIVPYNLYNQSQLTVMSDRITSEVEQINESIDSDIKSVNSRIDQTARQILASVHESYGFNSHDYVKNGSFTSATAMENWTVSNSTYISQSTYGGKNCAAFTSGTAYYIRQTFTNIKPGKYIVQLKAATDAANTATSRVRAVFNGTSLYSTAGEIGTDYTLLTFEWNVTTAGTKYLYIYNYKAGAPLYVTEIKLISSYEIYNEANLSVMSDRITAEVTRATGAENSLSSRITQTESSITSEITRAQNAESALSTRITQTADSIASKVSKGSEFYSLLQQEYNRVFIGFNGSSRNVQITSTGIGIYDGSGDPSSSTKVSELTDNGINLWLGGKHLGRIGVNSYTSGDRRLSFDITSDCDGMEWTRYNQTSGEVMRYLVSSNKMEFFKKIDFNINGTKMTIESDGPHLYNGAKLQCHSGCEILTHSGGKFYVAGGSKIQCASGAKIECDSGGEFLAHAGGKLYVAGGAKIQCAQNSELYIGDSSRINFYSNLNMNGYSILNNSDERLKKYIKPIETDALSAINDICLRQFTWRGTDKHVDVGMIAQQVQEIIPEAVHVDEKTGLYSLKLEVFIPYIIGAIQQISKAIPKEYSPQKYTDTEIAKARKLASPKE